ncbi:unnamed protein product [Ixodes hexagonus]
MPRSDFGCHGNCQTGSNELAGFPKVKRRQRRITAIDRAPAAVRPLAFRHGPDAGASASQERQMSDHLRRMSYGRSSEEVINSAKCWMQQECQLFWPEPGNWSRACCKDSIRSSLYDEEMVGLRCEWERKTDRKFQQNQRRLQQERQQEEQCRRLHQRRQR